LVCLAAALQAGCAMTIPGSGNSSSGSSGSNGGSGGSVSVTVSPSAASVRVGASQTFTAQVTGSSDQTVTWEANSVAGGSATTGTISSGGLYSAPAGLPNPNVIMISAVGTGVSGTSSVTLLNATPTLSAVTPASFAAGAFSLNVTGSAFVSGAQVFFGATPLATTFVSSTTLTATGTEPTAGMYGVSVMNPAPGSSSSGAINVQVTGGGGGGGGGSPSACSVMSPGQGGSLNGFVPFTLENLWNQDISGAVVDPNSAQIISFIGSSDAVHPDFGSGEYNGSTIGIPYTVVTPPQAFVTINFTAYGDESDPGPMPIPSNAPIEGYPNPGDGDRHVLVLDNSNCWLYELYATTKWPAAKSTTRCASRCSRAGLRSRRRLRIGRRRLRISMRRRWACGCG
jgi:hypothetical protein